MQCYTDIIFFSFFLFFTEKPDYYEQKTEFKRVILRRSTNKDDFSLVKFAWVYHAEKSKQKKNTNIFTQKISLRRFIYWFIFYALFEEERAYCFVAVCRAVWTIYWLQNIFKCYSVTQNRLCTVYYLKEILMFQLGYLYWGSAPPRATSP